MITSSTMIIPISIHAPTRGATIPALGKLIIDIHISIHAPTRGATSFMAEYQMNARFQSTLLQEERHLLWQSTR